MRPWVLCAPKAPPTRHSCYACPALPPMGTHWLFAPGLSHRVKPVSPGPRKMACSHSSGGDGMTDQKWGWGPSLKPKLVHGPPGPMARDKTVAKRNI